MNEGVCRGGKARSLAVFATWACDGNQQLGRSECGDLMLGASA